MIVYSLRPELASSGSVSKIVRGPQQSKLRRICTAPSLGKECAIFYPSEFCSSLHIARPVEITAVGMAKGSSSADPSMERHLWFTPT
jgi:hypothetical protein